MKHFVAIIDGVYYNSHTMTKAMNEVVEAVMVEMSEEDRNAYAQRCIDLKETSISYIYHQ